MRIMELAERFGLPVVTFVDVPGAHPGPESEERGIAESIARSIGLMSRLRTPIVTVITGEGGSGGALAIAVGDVVIALENSVYSVISPEGCAAILWRTADEAPAAALAMRMTAEDQQTLGVVDIVVPEPGDGAHAEPAETARRLKAIVIDRLAALDGLTIDQLLDTRYRRYRALGSYTETETPGIPLPADADSAIDFEICSIRVVERWGPPCRRGRATSRRPVRRSSECRSPPSPKPISWNVRRPNGRPTTPPSTALAPSCSRL